MEFDRSPETLADFNRSIRLPQPISTSIFSSMVKVATDCIDQAIGSGAPLVEYLRCEPPIPMKDRQDWNRFYGKLTCALDPSDQGPTEIRPDLVFHPIFLISVIAHEGTHAIDPKLREATIFVQCFETMTQDQADYGRNSFIWTAMENQLEKTAIEAEIQVLTNIKPPRFLIPEQREYFAQQQPACLAARTIQLAQVEASRVAIDLSRAVFERIEQEPSLASTPLLPATQNYLDYAIRNKGKGDNWPEVMIEAVRSVREYLSIFDCERGEDEIPFSNIIETLQDCRRVKESNEWLASKMILPRMKILP